MSGGQAALGLDASPSGTGTAVAAAPVTRGEVRIPVIRANEAELAAHERSLEAIDRASNNRAIFRAGAARGT